MDLEDEFFNEDIREGDIVDDFEDPGILIGDHNGDEHVDVFSDDEEEALDITASRHARGVDIQGIPWDTTSWTRDAYRAKRNEEYRNYYNKETDVILAQPIIKSQSTKTKEISTTNTTNTSPAYQFECNYRRLHTTIVHFQLRNLVCATSSDDIYYIDDNAVYHFNSLSRTLPASILDVSGRRRYAGTLGNDLGAVMLCTLCVKHGLVVAGGFGGEMVVHREGDMMCSDYGVGARGRVTASFRVSTSDNAITNAIEIYHNTNGALTIACSNNDKAIRLFDPTTAFTKTHQFDVPWAVNYTAPHPDGRLLCAVGDDTASYILDPSSGRTVAILRGHYDYSFSAAWHPSGYLVATGNQDKTTRVYDLRKPSKTLYLLPANIGAVRSLRWSANGKYLAVAEPADYVTIYDVSQAGGSGDDVCMPKQTIDLFGELSGISFSPDGYRLFVGVADVHYSSLLQYNQKMID